MGTSNIGFINPGEHIQRKQREWTDEWVDNHGRHFEGWYDIRNMRPIEELRPVGYNPPWLPPQRFIRWKSKGGFRFAWDYDSMAAELSGGTGEFYADVTKFMVEHMPASAPVEIGYAIPPRVRQVLGTPPMTPAIPLAAKLGDPWLLGVPGARKNEKLRELLWQSQGSNHAEVVESIQRQLAEVIGDGARPAEPSNPHEDERVNTKKVRTIDDVDEGAILASIDTKGYRQFIADAMRDGMSMAQSAALWHQHRATLAEPVPVAVAEDLESEPPF